VTVYERITASDFHNEEWNEANGGELVIYDKEDKYLTKTKRYSIAGWFRVDKL